jgi:uncharacterized protein
MPPAPRFPPDDPREWLNRARSNLRRAAVPAEGVYLEVRWAEEELERPGRLREQSARRYPSSPASSPGRDAAPDPALLQQVVERIVAAADPDRILLFGSGARGCMGPHSDLDLLVVKDGDWDRHEVDLAIRRSLRGLGIAMDLVLATPGELERYGRSIGLVYLPALEEGQVIYIAGSR